MCKTSQEISLWLAKEGEERSKLIWTMFGSSMCTNAAFLRCRKKQDELGTLTMVIGNTWVILLITLTLLWLIPVCYLILNHQLLKKSHHGVATTRELCTPVKLITLSAVDMAVPLLWNTKHFIPWKKRKKRTTHTRQSSILYSNLLHENEKFRWPKHLDPQNKRTNTDFQKVQLFTSLQKQRLLGMRTKDFCPQVV